MKKWLLCLTAAAGPACAQPADCVTQPVGPSVPLEARIRLDGRPGVPAGTTGSVRLPLGPQPLLGTLCGEPAQPLSDDVLHGPPAPHGLLQGNGPRDVLHNRYVPQVTVDPAPYRPPGRSP